ncbi:MAG: hypothetical protein D6737_01350 [Chloroflexi bacterium]|nr:MAG: hypothetical protein CUN54_07120 [Phototrophicales bacterium]RMF82588.1 MAG: hypothetical protein D6737_01350 [Chloroflexota bacterium]
MNAGHHTNPQDIERLSAYLDGMLSDSERSALEQQLQRDANLRRELATLRETVALINQLPPMKAPRNFTLTAQMLEERAPASPRILIFPTTAVFSAVSAVAAILLFVIGGILLLQSDSRAEQSTIAQSSQEQPLANIAAAPSPFATPRPQTGGAAGADVASDADFADVQSTTDTLIEGESAGDNEAPVEEAAVDDTVAGDGAGLRDDAVAATRRATSGAEDFAVDETALSAISEADEAQFAPAEAAESAGAGIAPPAANAPQSQQFAAPEDTNAPTTAGQAAQDESGSAATPVSADESAVGAVNAQQEPSEAVIAPTQETIVAQRSAGQPATEIADATFHQQDEFRENNRAISRVDNVDNEDRLAIALLILGVLLLSIATVTTIARRRVQA